MNHATVTRQVQMSSSSRSPRRRYSSEALQRAINHGRPPKFYRVGEVVEYCGLSRQTIHNYTTMGLIHEAKWTDGGHRMFDEDVFERLDIIAELKKSGKSMDYIREYIRRAYDRPDPGCET
jgi:predicted transcriptional regulator